MSKYEEMEVKRLANDLENDRWSRQQKLWTRPVKDVANSLRQDVRSVDSTLLTDDVVAPDKPSANRCTVPNRSARWLSTNRHKSCIGMRPWRLSLTPFPLCDKKQMMHGSDFRGKTINMICLARLAPCLWWSYACPDMPLKQLFTTLLAKGYNWHRRRTEEPVPDHYSNI